MESLTLNDGQPYQRHVGHAYSKDRRRYSPRLPTPEDSRSSNETFDHHNPPGSVSIGMPDGMSHYRRDSRNTTAPHSPPYRLADGQKPSLPPLKTVLGDKISSPPRTPSPNSTPLQPSPREPSYTAMTYKPPALYPNKKQRTEPIVNSAPPHSGATTLSSPYPPSTTLEPRLSGSLMRPNIQFPPLSSQMDGIEMRRPSMQSVTASSPPCANQYPPQGQHGKINPASHYQTPEQTPTSTMLEPSFPRMSAGFAGAIQDPFAKEMRDSFGHPGDRPISRRPSSGGYSAYPQRTYERDHPRTLPYHQGTRYSMPLRDGYPDHRESARYGRPDEQGPRPGNGFGQPTYQGNVPSYFMPSHYEYQHGKARKRSNLPKQSTEIMKTWFDQNITNPYPSEEQKAIFSNATGISMTQVSNWFINHRRRCPELRDKREKSRGSRDGDL